MANIKEAEMIILSSDSEDEEKDEDTPPSKKAKSIEQDNNLPSRYEWKVSDAFYRMASMELKKFNEDLSVIKIEKDPIIDSEVESNIQWLPLPHVSSPVANNSKTKGENQTDFGFIDQKVRKCQDNLSFAPEYEMVRMPIPLVDEKIIINTTTNMMKKDNDSIKPPCHEQISIPFVNCYVEKTISFSLSLNKDANEHLIKSAFDKLNDSYPDETLDFHKEEKHSDLSKKSGYELVPLPFIGENSKIEEEKEVQVPVVSSAGSPESPGPLITNVSIINLNEERQSDFIVSNNITPVASCQSVPKGKTTRRKCQGSGIKRNSDHFKRKSLSFSMKSIDLARRRLCGLIRFRRPSQTWKNKLSKTILLQTVPETKIFQNVPDTLNSNAIDSNQQTKRRGKGGRRPHYNSSQNEFLCEVFEKNPLPDINERESLAEKTNLNIMQINRWFHYKRVNAKKATVNAEQNSKNCKVNNVNTDSLLQGPLEIDPEMPILKPQVYILKKCEDETQAKADLKDEQRDTEQVEPEKTVKRKNKKRKPKSIDYDTYQILNKHFNCVGPLPIPHEVDMLSKETKLSTSQIRKWFENKSRDEEEIKKLEEKEIKESSESKGFHSFKPKWKPVEVINLSSDEESRVGQINEIRIEIPNSNSRKKEDAVQKYLNSLGDQNIDFLDKLMKRCHACFIKLMDMQTEDYLKSSRLTEESKLLQNSLDYFNVFSYSQLKFLNESLTNLIKKYKEEGNEPYDDDVNEDLRVLKPWCTVLLYAKFSKSTIGQAVVNLENYGSGTSDYIWKIPVDLECFDS